MSLLVVRDLVVRYRADRGRVDAVAGVSFAVAEGRTLAIVGGSGSGKTAIASALLRLLPENAEVSGTATFLGRDLLALSRAELDEVRGAQLAIVFQEPMSALNPVLTVGFQVAEVLVRHRGMRAREAQERVAALFAEVGLPDPAGKLERYPHQLSGGEKQRVMIAMALACDPRLIVMDEPTTSLDALTEAQILALLAELRAARGLSLLFISHDLDVVRHIADEVIVLRDGRIVEEGPTEQVLRAPTHPHTRELLACRPRPEVGWQPIPAAADAAPPARPPGEVLLAVEGLVVDHGAVRAVDRVSLTVRAGSTLGLVGASGSGKTTLARAVLRLVPVTAGSIRFAGEDFLALRGRSLREHRRHLQIVFQDAGASLNPRLTLGAMLVEPMAAHGIGANDVERRERAASLLREVGLAPELVGRFPHELSGGQRQRAVLARALTVEPRLLVCDEPVSSVDGVIRAQILNLLLELRERRGLAYLFVSHDLGLVRFVADEIAVMHAGRIVEHGPAAQVWSAPEHPYTRRLLTAGARVPPAR